MSMQINADPSKMSIAQRKMVSDFIMNYPTGETVGKLNFEIGVDTTQATASLDALKDKVETTNAAITQTPESAFGTTLQNSVNETLRQNDIEAASKLVGVDIDKNGSPWDARIHSSNKAKTSDGTWRKRRGIADATVTAVEAELRAVMGAPAAVAPVAPTPPVESMIVENYVPPAPVADTMPPIPASLVRPQVPVAPVTPIAPTPPAAPAPDGIRNAYVALIGRTSAAVHQKKITQEQVAACCLKYGVPALPLLANRLDLVPQIAA